MERPTYGSQHKEPEIQYKSERHLSICPKALWNRYVFSGETDYIGSKSWNFTSDRIYFLVSNEDNLFLNCFMCLFEVISSSFTTTTLSKNGLHEVARNLVNARF